MSREDYPKGTDPGSIKDYEDTLRREAAQLNKNMRERKQVINDQLYREGLTMPKGTAPMRTQEKDAPFMTPVKLSEKTKHPYRVAYYVCDTCNWKQRARPTGIWPLCPKCLQRTTPTHLEVGAEGRTGG